MLIKYKNMFIELYIFFIKIQIEMYKNNFILKDR